MFEIVRGEKIGKVLFIVEGDDMEPYLIKQVFCGIYDYRMERVTRGLTHYEAYSSTRDPDSRVFVVNTRTSNIKSISQTPAKKDKPDANVQFLDALFQLLVDEYALDIDNAAIYYLFDRDPGSNTDAKFIRGMLSKLDNARESHTPEMLRQGLLLLSYPCIESFTAMNLLDDSLAYCWNNRLSIGKYLKKAIKRDVRALEKAGCQSHIDESTLLHCAGELLTGLQSAGVDTEKNALLNSFDAFASPNLTIFDCQEDCYRTQRAYGCLSLLCVALLDLGLIRIV